MKNTLITFLLLLIVSTSFAQGNYYFVPNTNNLRTYIGSKTFDGEKFVVYAIGGDEYKTGTKGGLFRYCDTCIHAIDDSVNTYRQQDVEAVYVRLTTRNYTSWNDTSTVLSYVKSYLASLQTQVNNVLPSPTSNNNKVMVVNGSGNGYSLVNAAALVTSLGNAYNSSNQLTTTANFLSGSPVSSSPLVVPPAKVPSFPTRALGTTGWTPHANKESLVYYTVSCTATNPLLAGTSFSSFALEYYNTTTSSWVLLENTGNSNGVGLAVAVALTNGQTGVLSSYVPAGVAIRITNTNTGSATGTLVKSVEWN